MGARDILELVSKEVEKIIGKTKNIEKKDPTIIENLKIK